jgi:hypothetical protein
MSFDPWDFPNNKFVTFYPESGDILSFSGVNFIDFCKYVIYSSRFTGKSVCKTGRPLEVSGGHFLSGNGIV